MRLARRATVIGAAAAATTLALVVPALAADPEAPQPTRPPGMERMHELMQQGNPGMERMDELMMQGNPGMQRMHELMTSGAPPRG